MYYLCRNGESAMEATEILEKARAGGELPKGWIVLPLLRSKVRLGILGWIAGAIIGFGLFVVMVPLMIPHNYLFGFIPALINRDLRHGAFCWHWECLANHC